MISAVCRVREWSVCTMSVRVCVLGGMGELVQWRNPIGLSDNTQAEGEDSDNTAYSLGRRKGHTLNLTDTHMHATKTHTQTTSLPTLNLSFLSLPLHCYI